ncbi:alpha/beta fold hydrolase [Kibdelosporangium philippinense]|uniref:Alpha/beta fold hydrolase n=1 Tax=Kibdelosporangium philippinense TaxID=211113 RepID=A0ABS8ZJP0_9PSEU|nr:alpha/beta fold hydrolase [Kibdelosporangium philippinense]MCE7006851.1 alpha/beta fold hydrolase [Kibdelosporangium philippinense]
MHISTDLGRIHVQVSGSGTPIVFWSSLLMDGSMWTAQEKHFADRYQVVLVDPPGHGQSDPLTELFTFDECARCVTQILDGIGAERAHFVGNSWGGMIGGTLAAHYPSRVISAVLMNCTGSPAPRAQKIEYGLLRHISRVIGMRGPLVKSAVDAFTGPTTRCSRPEVVARIDQAIRRIDVRSTGRAVTSVVPRRPNQLPLFKQISVPVLVVAGAQDATFPVAETKAMADAIPGAKFVVLPDTAHLAGLENPDEVNALIDDFLTG